MCGPAPFRLMALAGQALTGLHAEAVEGLREVLRDGFVRATGGLGRRIH